MMKKSCGLHVVYTRRGDDLSARRPVLRRDEERAVAWPERSGFRVPLRKKVYSHSSVTSPIGLFLSSRSACLIQLQMGSNALARAEGFRLSQARSRIRFLDSPGHGGRVLGTSDLGWFETKKCPDNRVRFTSRRGAMPMRLWRTGMREKRAYPPAGSRARSASRNCPAVSSHVGNA